ncbi:MULTISPECIES: cobalamin biosynthesis protein [unclassified Bradyrhizobium]|nr:MULTISPECIES: cobalamin biosynthesis protein [unclassified Bradyrhizobium]
MIALGIGCRRNASADDIERLIAEALTMAALQAESIGVVATERAKAEEPGIIEAARRLGRPLIGIVASELGRVSHSAVTNSDRVQHLKGVPSVAETAALAAAGAHARLILPRIANARATCALAEGEGQAAGEFQA